VLPAGKPAGKHSKTFPGIEPRHPMSGRNAGLLSIVPSEQNAGSKIAQQDCLPLRKCSGDNVITENAVKLVTDVRAAGCQPSTSGEMPDATLTGYPHDCGYPVGASLCVVEPTGQGFWLIL
jgi:hypothetical protein